MGGDGKRVRLDCREPFRLERPAKARHDFPAGPNAGVTPHGLMVLAQQADSRASRDATALE